MFLALISFVVLALVAELAFGPVWIAPDRVLVTLFGRGSEVETAILWQIRIPRAVLGIATGASLALAGAALQGLLRNPLAEPALIGVTAGASLGAVLIIVLGAGLVGYLPIWIAHFLLPAAAFVGSGVVIALLFWLARRAKTAAIATIILTGVAINAIVGAAIGVLIYISDDQQLRDLSFWLLGSIGKSPRYQTARYLVSSPHLQAHHFCRPAMWRDHQPQHRRSAESPH